MVQRYAVIPLIEVCSTPPITGNASKYNLKHRLINNTRNKRISSHIKIFLVYKIRRQVYKM